MGSDGFLPEALVLSVKEIDGQHEALFALLEEIKVTCIASNELPMARARELINFCTSISVPRKILLPMPGTIFQRMPEST